MTQASIVRELYWIAVYADGTKLYQFDDKGNEYKYADIDREKLVRFDIVSKEEKRIIYSMYLREGQRLIFRRRTLKPLDQRKPTVVIFLVGWQMTIPTPSGMKNVTAINYFHPDGSIALDGDRDNIELLEMER